MMLKFQPFMYNIKEDSIFNQKIYVSFFMQLLQDVSNCAWEMGYLKRMDKLSKLSVVRKKILSLYRSASKVILKIFFSQLKIICLQRYIQIWWHL